ncbi:butyrophilin-like protein 2 [Macrotis lagotis]|uniref:butyrophilin-like protein 2 n=1 Tax=Macrotis lagotis TaxID=92651 RepID=UPI003D68033B
MRLLEYRTGRVSGAEATEKGGARRSLPLQSWQVRAQRHTPRSDGHGEAGHRLRKDHGQVLRGSPCPSKFGLGSRDTGGGSDQELRCRREVIEARAGQRQRQRRPEVLDTRGDGGSYQCRGDSLDLRVMFLSAMIKWNYWPAFYICSILPFFLILGLPGIHNSDPFLPGPVIQDANTREMPGKFAVSGPLVQPMLPLVGEDVLLSCHLFPKMDARGMGVKLVRGPLVVVLYRKGQEVEDVQAPAFQGRTKMLRQDMAEGKMTVSIHQVHSSDSGQYTCYFQAGTFYNESSFNLTIREPQRRAFSVIGPAQPIHAKQGEDATLSCGLFPKMDAQNMTVKWFRHKTLIYRFPNGEKLEESQGAEFQGRTELLTSDLAEGKVTLRIQQVQVFDSGSYTCHVRSPENYDEAHAELQVTETLDVSQKTFHETIVIVILVIFFGSLFVIFC